MVAIILDIQYLDAKHLSYSVFRTLRHGDSVVLPVLFFIQLYQSYLPDVIAGISVGFGGVNSTKAYLAATWSFGRACVIKSVIRKLLIFNKFFY